MYRLLQKQWQQDLRGPTIIWLSEWLNAIQHLENNTKKPYVPMNSFPSHAFTHKLPAIPVLNILVLSPPERNYLKQIFLTKAAGLLQIPFLEGDKTL